MATMRYEDLTAIAEKQGDDNNAEQQRINDFNSDAAKAGLKSLSMTQYLTVQAKYFKTHYSGYTAAASALLISGLYLGALVFAPAVIPFGLASLSGFMNYAVIGAAITTALSSLYVLVPRTIQQMKNLKERFDDKALTSYDLALLGGIAVLGAAHAVALFAMPSLLPVVLGSALSTAPKAAVAAITGGASLLAGYAMFKGRPDAPTTPSPAPTTEQRPAP